VIEEIEEIELRPKVRRFAEEMERALRKHEDKPGWAYNTPSELLERLLEEVDELEDAIDVQQMHLHAESRGVLIREVADACADVANFCLFIADVVGGLDD